MDDRDRDARRTIGVLVVLLVCAVGWLGSTISSKNDQLEENRKRIGYLEAEVSQLHDLETAANDFVQTVCDDAESQEPSYIGGDAYGNPVEVPNPSYKPELIAACLSMELGV